MRVIIDRFEENYAVCEEKNKKMLNIERKLIPLEAAEGDVLEISGDKIRVDKEETMRRKNEIEKLTKDLWK